MDADEQHGVLRHRRILRLLMVAGRARLVEAEKGTLVDRAWEGVLTALRSFATPERPERVAE